MRVATLCISALAACLASAAEPAVDEEKEEVELAEVAITGSRIQVVSGMNTPTPVTAVSAEDLQNLSPGTLMDALDQLPQFLNNATVEEAGSWTRVGGQSNLNLRGVGTNRTLVLLDGRRIVPSNRLSTVDISLFPQALVERTDVVTGGASAAYGSDAVTGVTNFILKKSLTGITANLQGGISDVGDNKNITFSLAGGTPIGDRAHIIMGGEYYKADGIDTYDGRDWYQPWGDINFGVVGGVPVQTPQRVRYADVRTRNYTFGGLIRTGFLAGTQFLRDGTPAPFINGTVLDQAATNGLNAITAANPRGQITGSQVGGSGDVLAREGMILPTNTRGSFLTRLGFDVNESTELSLQALVGYSKVDNAKGGWNFTTPWALTIYRENAFLPESIRSQMGATGPTSSFQLHKVLPASDPLYNATAPLTSLMYSITAGVDGKLGNGSWKYNGYLQYGASNRDLDLTGYRIDRWFKGIDTTLDTNGNPICRSTLTFPGDGCVPINPFGLGNETQAARDWVQDGMYSKADVTQTSAEISANGQLFEGWAAPIMAAIGADYRKDTLDQYGVDANGQRWVGNPNGPVRAAALEGYRGLPTVYVGQNLIDQANGPTLKGDFSVWEAFGETLVPLLRGQPLAKSVDVNLAARYAHYNSSGGIWAWKAGLDWQLVNDLRLRLTRSRDIRAGSLAERFDLTTGGGTVIDRFLTGEPSYTIVQVQGGNPDVAPEHADTLTYGLVYQPSFADGLAISADMYDIQIAEAITQIGVQTIMDTCFNTGVLCQYINRSGDGLVQNIYNLYVNLDEARTRGLDLEVSYRTRINLFGGGESLTVRAIGSRIYESSTTPAGGVKEDNAGEAATAAHWNATMGVSYNRGPLSLHLQQRYVGHANRDNTYVSGVQIDRNVIPGQFLTSLRGTYDFKLGDGPAYSVYGTVNNVFDKHPWRNLPGPYSVVGRTYTLGVKVDFN
jgi:outer membrane receptor protein involved in Fe transport